MRIRFSLLHFKRRPRLDPAVPRTDHIDPLPPPNNATQVGPPDRQTILAQWRYLGSLDLKSQGYIELLKTLVDVEDNRNVALKFIDDDAGIVINIIGKILRGGGIPCKLAGHTFSMLRKLAGKTGRLPDDYLVNKGAGYQVEEKAFAGGGFAEVRKGKLAKKVVAVKTIRTAQESDMSKIRRDFCKEAVLWMHVSHPNLLKLIAVDIDPQAGAFSMISEMMDHGNILHYIRFNEANRLRLLEDVARGLRYLHQREIVHGDLKGTNILIKNGATPQACISDFGFSTLMPTMSFVMSASAEACKGTCSHMAPELIIPKEFGLPDSRVSKQADIYAFGMAVYEVLTGHPPFGTGRLPATIMFQVTRGERPSKPERAGEIGFGGGTWEVVQQCWNPDRDERPRVERILKHFHQIARTPTIVPPGPTISVREAEQSTAFESHRGPEDFDPLFSSPSQSYNTSVVQQAKFFASLMAGGGNAHPMFSVPGVQLVRSKLDRFGARIRGRGPALRLGAPPSVRA